MTLGERIADKLENFIRELVDEPEKTNVNLVTGANGKTIILTITSCREDIGKIIGRNGRTAQAIRHLLEAIAARHKIKLVSEIDDGRN